MKEDRNKALQDMLRHLNGGDAKKAMDELKRAMPEEEIEKPPVVEQKASQGPSM